MPLISVLKPFIKTFEVNPNGSKRALVIGGVHGNEYTPIYSLMCLNKSLGELLNLEKNQFDPNHEIKEVTLLNGINYTGLSANTREIASEFSEDLNRKFVESESENIFEYLKAQIDQHDVIIDIHASAGMVNECMLIDLNENAYPYIEWCKKSGVVYALRYNDNQTIKKYAIRHGKVGATLEIDGLSPINEKSGVAGASIVAKLLGEYKSELFSASYEQTELSPMTDVKAKRTGIFKFPYLFDYAGNIIEDYSSLTDRAIVKCVDQVYMKPESFLFSYQP
jgi:predicted deacylase